MEWHQLIKDLNDIGMSQLDIARVVGVSQPSISAIATGNTKRPSYDLGSKLLELHQAKLGTRKNKAAA